MCGASAHVSLAPFLFSHRSMRGLCSNSAAILTFLCGKESMLGGREEMPGESPPGGTKKDARGGRP